MSEIELKPCPFCGGEAWAIDEEMPTVGCASGSDCFAPSAHAPTLAGAADLWNTRSQSERVSRLEEALTPSAATKAAYIGEFSFLIDEQDDEQMCEVTRKVDVPWTTIKEIMAAILARSALNQSDGSTSTPEGEHS